MSKLLSVIVGVGSVFVVNVAASAADAAAGSKTQSAAAAAPASPAVSGLVGAQASPSAPAIVALEADGITFGASAEDVARTYDRWWDKQFVPKYRKTNPGPKMKELDFELAQKKKLLRRVFHFDGRSATHDKAAFREEFAHGNGETMTSVKVVRPAPGSAGPAKQVSYTRRFFFFQDKLWKIYDEYRLGADGLFGATFKDATARVEASLGATAKRTRGPDSAYENVTFDSGETRVRVVKLGEDRVALVRSDNALAREVLDRRAQNANAPEVQLDEDIQAVIR